VRHVAFEDLGSWGPVLSASGFDVSVMDAGVDDVFEPIVRSDLVVILGGPIGAYEADRYPFLVDELRAIGKRLRESRPTLGICLGAQLMAAALGSRVYPGGQKEIGYGPLELTEEGRASCLAKLDAHAVLHWHGDTFDLPPGAALLAKSAMYDNQAFSLGTNVLGLQFHAEVDALRFEQWLIGHAAELAATGTDIAELRRLVRQGANTLRAAGTSALRHWLENVVWNG
jgi:GMP synthase (glutamine-hydrolysing)